MAITPTELYNKVLGVVKEQQEYTQALIYETIGLRHGVEQLVGGVTKTVTLEQAFPVGVNDYIIWRQVTETDGTYSEVEVISKSNDSFQVKAPRDCTFEYITTKPEINIQP
jgi:hypothetical protein